MKYNSAISYLRGFIVALVVLHHVLLGYHPYAPMAAASLVTQPRWWLAFPVVDAQRWSGALLITGFNDVFFMSLMFLISGLFVWPALARKGTRRFLRERTLRLGIPFAASVLMLAPLAYYPAYLQTHAHNGVTGFLHEWASLGSLPAGPAWFVWVLLVFDVLAAVLFHVAPRWGGSLGLLRPTAMFALLTGVSAVVYVPMALAFGPGTWTEWGPFTFQTSRVFHYLAYFLIGAGVGATGLQSGALARIGKLAQRWYVWIAAAAVLFLGASIVAVATLTSHAQSRGWEIAMDCGFVLSCAASALAFLAVFVRFAGRRSRLFDSLSANSYVIYIVHYAITSWVLLALLPASMPIAVKAAIAFGSALGLSWMVAAALRRIPQFWRAIWRVRADEGDARTEVDPA